MKLEVVVAQTRRAQRFTGTGKPDPFSTTQSYRPMVYGFPLSYDFCRDTADRLAPLPAGQVEEILSIQRLEVVKDYVQDRFEEVWPSEKLRYNCCKSHGTRPTISFTDNYAGNVRGARVPVMPTAEQKENLKALAQEIGLCTKLRWYIIHGLS